MIRKKLCPQSNQIRLIKLKEVEKLIKSKIEDGRKIETWWLNVEDAYEENGWEVLFHRPGYNETDEAYYSFKGQT